MTQFALLVLVLALVSCLPFAVAAFLALSSETRAEEALRRTVRHTPAAGQRGAGLHYARPGVGHRYSRFTRRIERIPPPLAEVAPAAPLIAVPQPDRAAAA